MKHVYSFFTVVLFLIGIGNLNAQQVGDIILIGFDSQIGTGTAGEPDKITFVVTRNISESRTIYITDRGWGNTDNTNGIIGFGSTTTNEGTITWTTPASMSRGDVVEFDITAGASASTQVTYNGTVLSGSPTVTTGWTDNAANGSPLGRSGENILAFYGSDADTPTQWITAWVNRSFVGNYNDQADRTSQPDDLTTDSAVLNAGCDGSDNNRRVARFVIPSDDTDFIINPDNRNTLVNGIDDQANWECSSSSLNITFDYFDDGTLSVTDAKQLENLSIYPNPTKGELNFNLPLNVRIENIEVYNTAGAKVAQGKENINLSNLNSGIYFVKVKTTEGEVLKKVIKQ